MHKLILAGLWMVVLIVLACLGSLAHAQQENATTGTAVQVSCAADGSSTQALGLNNRRRSLSLQNKAGKQIRIGFIAGSATPDLTTSNSFVLEASSNYVDSVPGVYVGRIVCMSTDASTAALDVTETQR